MWDEQGWMLVGFLSALFPPTEQSGTVKRMRGGQQTDLWQETGLGDYLGFYWPQLPGEWGPYTVRGGE